jgi:hypothetical protein
LQASLEKSLGDPKAAQRAIIKKDSVIKEVTKEMLSQILRNAKNINK